MNTNITIGRIGKMSSRDFSVFPEESGIYCFENLKNNKKYIGQTKNIRVRIRRHINSLEKNKDDSEALQGAWNKYGESSFIVYILELCPIENLDEREIYYIKELNSHVSKMGYNIALGGNVPMRGRHHSDATKEKISDSGKRFAGENNPFYGKKHTEESLQKMSDNHVDVSGDKNPMFGKNHTEETRQKMSENYRRDGRKPRGSHSEETRRKIGEGNKGKTASEESRQKMSESRIGKKMSKRTSEYIGVCFDKHWNKWISHIRYQGKTIRLGGFKSEIEAAIAYNNAAIKYYGDSAKLNVLPEQ
jgi:group I intron endonuclease